MKKENYLKLILKIFATIVILFLNMNISFISIMYCLSYGVTLILCLCSALILPTLFIPLLYVKDKRKVFKFWLIFIVVYVISLLVNLGINSYQEKITIDTSPNIDIYEYLPFDENSKIVKLDKEASLKFVDNLPRVDGAAAVFPVYSAFVNATYPDSVKLYDGMFEYNNTVRGYRLLAEKETDIFFGAYPSKEQIDYARRQGTEFKYTEIGKEAFVFFVHKDNPINNLTTEQVQKIYSGEITNWKELGGLDEKIVAFQRNGGSGSQSMLIRFMDGKDIMEAPTEQVNDLMSGIVDVVANYKNKTSSIGFSFRYYLEGIIKNPDIKLLSIDGIHPTVENIRQGKYSITTFLYAVTYENNNNDNVGKLINWIKSSEGQEIIEKTGYIGI